MTRQTSSVLVLLALVGVIAAAFVLAPRGEQQLHRSSIGMAGLQHWLKAQDIPVRTRSFPIPIERQGIGLWLLPLYDTTLDRNPPPPRTARDRILASDLIQQRSKNIRTKIRLAPSLVVLPKWRDGVRLTRRAHPVLLTHDVDTERVLRQVLEENSARIVRNEAGFSDHNMRGSTTGQQAQLYLAQAFYAPGCTPLIGSGLAMILGECKLDKGNSGNERTVLILSDPDLLNAHGLRLGDNAHVVADILRDRASGKDVVIDYTADVALFNEHPPAQPRTWADLVRFVQMPFLAIWIGAGIALALALWRSARRAGPVQRVAGRIDKDGRIAMRARARLMRRTGRDGALLDRYAEARLAALAHRLFGPHLPRGQTARAAVLAYVARHQPLALDALNAALAAIAALPDKITAAQAARHIDDLEDLLDRIAHDA